MVAKSPAKTKKSANSGKIYLRVIADYGPVGDMAFAEVTDRLHVVLRDAGVTDYHIDLTNVPPFDTYATGFVLAQLAVNSKLGAQHLFYVNTAPRKDRRSARINNEGEGLVYARLKNGVRIVAVNSGYSLTFIKPFATEIRELRVAKAGSQFRSRDIFPVAVGAVLRGEKSIMGRDVRKTVPDRVNENVVVYTDGYGNLKTNINPEDLKKHKGKALYVKVGDAENIPIEVGAGIFDVADGEFCLARGSSGWALPGKGKTKSFAEVIKRGGSAARAVRHPEGGTDVLWKPVARKG